MMIRPLSIMKLSKQIRLGISLILCVILIYSGTEKLLNVDSFIINLGKSGYIKTNLVIIVAYTIIILELLIGLFIIFLNDKKFPFIMSTVLFVGFLIYNIVLYNTSNNYDCGCSKLLESLSYSEHLFLVYALIVISLFNTFDWSGLVFKFFRSR